MCAKHLSVNELYPPFAGGGLWRMWCLLLFASIHHHPPEAFDGAKSLLTQDLSNVRHLRVERENDGAIYGGPQIQNMALTEHRKNLELYS